MLTPVDPEQMALLASPWPIAIILTIYLLFVLKVGPWLMAGRKPFDLRGVIKVYNILQILFNGLLSVIGCYILFVWRPYDLRCMVSLPLDHELKDTERLLSNAYAINKFVDLFETVIFVLRKKDRQISFLHVFHHCAMIFCVYLWTTLYGPAGVATLMCFLNLIVHTLMYTYYFLSSISPAVQASLWWKKYITIAQLIQFAIAMLYCLQVMTLPDCKFPRIFACFILALGAFFTVMFGKFYYQAYVVPSRKKL